MTKTTTDGLIIIESQAELDAALATNSNARIEIGGTLDLSVSLLGKPFFRLKATSRLLIRSGWAVVEAWESSHVEARGSSHVEARGSSHVVAWESSHVVAWESSHVVARGSSHVVAWESSHVEAWESSHVEAWGSSHVVAWESSHVVARGSSHVVAWESSHVEAWESSHVEAWGSSHVVAWESSHVVARGSSHVVAWESSHVVARAYVALRLFGLRVEATAVATVAVYLNDGAKCEGGHQVVVKEPETGAEFCDLHGIKPDAPFKVDGLDGKILAAIKAGQGSLDMSSWHGEDTVTEQNWCGTTHCRAGYAVCMAGKEGFDLERKVGAEMAGRMIYAVSRPDMPLPDFFAGDDDAIADMEEAAKAKA